MLDRKTQPTIYPIAELQLLEPKETLFNNTKLIEFKGGDKEVVRLRVICNAGTKAHENPVIPVAVNALMKEGTTNHTAEELADALDFYGAFLHTEITKDRAWVELYCLTKHLENVLPFFAEILTQASFPEREWEVYKQNAIQKLRVNKQKVSFLSRTNLQSALFGEHPYGKSVDEVDYNDVSPKELKTFYQEQIAQKITVVELAGVYEQKHLDLIQSLLSLNNQSLPSQKASQDLSEVSEHSIFIKKEDAVQSAIAIGRRFPVRTHEDFLGMKILVTVLGGYFGSRLMSNIREDKGYTYGIGAGLGSYQELGVLSIGTEVGVDVKDAALTEIYKELQRLIDEPIPSEELNLVKNYMKGTLLKQCDGLFAQADLLNNLEPFNLPLNYYSNYIKVIDKISSEELQQLAVKYLQKSDFVEVVAGGK